MIGTSLSRLAALLVALSFFGRERTEIHGFRVSLVPSCQTPRKHRGVTDFLGSSVTLTIDRSGKLRINGDDFHDQNLETVLKEVFSTRIERTLFVWPESDIEMGRLFSVLDRVHTTSVVKRVVLIT